MAILSPADCLAHRAHQFEEWSQVYKWTWDNKAGRGKVFYIEPAIQHSGSKSFPTQHGGSEALLTIKTEPKSSREIFLLQNTSSQSSYSSPHPHSEYLPQKTISSAAESDLVLFSTEYFAARKSLNKGYGAFAIQDIEAGTLVIAEAPLFKATTATIFIEYERLSREQKKEFSKLYGWKELSSHPILAKFLTNRFTINLSTAGIFPKSSRFNHECSPVRSCSYTFNHSKDQLEVVARRSIKKGEELTITYNHNPSTLYEDYGFYCDCSVCRPTLGTVSKVEEDV